MMFELIFWNVTRNQKNEQSLEKIENKYCINFRNHWSTDDCIVSGKESSQIPSHFYHQVAMCDHELVN